MRYQLCLFFTIVSAVSTLHATQAVAELRPNGATRDDSAITAATDSGEVQLLARELQAQIAFPNGKTARGALLVLFDPASGYTLKQFTWLPGDQGRIPLRDNFESYSKAYLAPDRLLVFTQSSGLIYVRESKMKATSIDDAEAKALRDSTGDLDGYVAKVTAGPKISLHQHLGQEFATEPGNSMPGPVKLLGVSRRDGKWVITVSGRWKAEVTLDEKYEVVATRRLQ
jgi:hypothetical protein